MYSARSQLGINLMRLGQNEEAYKQLEICFNNDFQDAATTQLAEADGQLQELRHVHHADRTILKLNKKEAELLRPYFESEMQRAIATYEKKYKMKLEKPVQVEVYPDHEDFAVRTLGMPGLGALGVTFGYSIAMDSPSGRKPGTFHWASHAVARNEPRVHADRHRPSRAALVHRGHGGARRDRRLARLGRPPESRRDRGDQG